MSAAKPKLVGAALAPLVYWLLIVSGLAGITVLRFGSYGTFVTADDVFALWAGSIGGVALGQLVSWARIRSWVPAVLAMFGFWFLLPILFLVLDGIFGATAQTFVLAFLPGAICGYLSLTERGALLAFWYPAVLWMIVILDGPTPGAFDQRFALPFVVGLAALFVVYLRARESRRVAIWKAHANERLAESMPRTVLRGSPIRAASQHVWSAMVGASALVLTTWIAPHLWQTVNDQSRTPAATAHHGHGLHGDPAAQPCCPTSHAKKREKVKEYFALHNGHDTDESDDAVSSTCRACAFQGPVASTAQDPWSYGGSPGAGLSAPTIHAPDAPSWSYGSWEGGGYQGYPSSIPEPGINPWYTNAPPEAPVTAVTPAPAPTPAAAPAPIDPALATPANTPHASEAPTASTSESSPVAIAPTSGGTITLPAPWKSSLGLCIMAFAFILFSRASRRALTLRHLARPFWNESLDQRISNQWERVLIGLRDAGLHPRTDEQPAVFARRIGIEGLETCATILDRVRHGVRVDADDLTNMSAAAENVFRTAQHRAGLAARATAWLRWPMT